MTTENVNSNPKGPMTVLGFAYIGETLIARPNSISDADGIDWTTVSYQWLRDGQPIDGATDTTYLVSTVDEGAALSVQFTYTDYLGFEATVVSDPEDPVPEAGTQVPRDFAPVNPLAILGDAMVGETLTARPNGITDENGIDATTAAYQWLRDGEPIEGATAQDYQVVEADLGAELSVIYSYQDDFGTFKSVTSNPKPATQPAEDPEPIILDDTDSFMTHLIGTPLADTLTATEGLERISGLGGSDTVAFQGDQASYTVQIASGSVTVTARETDLGTIRLDGVERIDFDTEAAPFSGPLDLDVFAGHAALSRTDLEGIIEIYIAYFNRAPDAIGLGFWATAVSNGTTLEELAAKFADQSETMAAYPDELANDVFVQQVYSNVLGRETDEDGLQFWVSALDSGAVSRDQFILNVLEGAKSELKLENGYDFVSQQIADRDYLENKVDIGAYFAVHLGMSDVQNASDVMALYDGTQAGINSSVDAIESHYADALDPNSGEFLLQLVGVLDSPFLA